MRNKNAYDNKWKRMKNRAIVREVKLGPCLDCGVHWPGEMVLHHRDPRTKSFNPVGSNSRGERRLRLEIAKCDLLCKWCHYNRHRALLEVK